jgi:hypothetical protein
MLEVPGHAEFTATFYVRKVSDRFESLFKDSGLSQMLFTGRSFAWCRSMRLRPFVKPTLSQLPAL